MIIYDKPTVWKRSIGPSSHLMSDLENSDAARKELLDFGLAIGLKSSWLQKRSVPWHTHFDIWGWKLTAARAAGATEVDRYTLHEIITNKRRICLEMKRLAA